MEAVEGLVRRAAAVTLTPSLFRALFDAEGLRYQ
jgi:hypothetical protein